MGTLSKQIFPATVLLVDGSFGSTGQGSSAGARHANLWPGLLYWAGGGPDTKQGPGPGQWTHVLTQDIFGESALCGQFRKAVSGPLSGADKDQQLEIIFGDASFVGLFWQDVGRMRKRRQVSIFRAADFPPHANIANQVSSCRPRKVHAEWPRQDGLDTPAVCAEICKLASKKWSNWNQAITLRMWSVQD